MLTCLDLMGKALSKQSGISCFCQIIYQIKIPAADVDEKRRKNYIFQRTGSEFKQAYWMFRGKLKRVSNIREHTTDCKNRSLRFKAYIFSGRELLGCEKSKKITIQQHGYHKSQAILQKVNLLSICVKMSRFLLLLIIDHQTVLLLYTLWHETN